MILGTSWQVFLVFGMVALPIIGITLSDRADSRRHARLVREDPCELSKIMCLFDEHPLYEPCLSGFMH